MTQELLVFKFMSSPESRELSCLRGTDRGIARALCGTALIACFTINCLNIKQEMAGGQVLMQFCFAGIRLSTFIQVMLVLRPNQCISGTPTPSIPTFTRMAKSALLSLLLLSIAIH